MRRRKRLVTRMKTSRGRLNGLGAPLKHALGRVVPSGGQWRHGVGADVRICFFRRLSTKPVSAKANQKTGFALMLRFVLSCSIVAAKPEILNFCCRRHHTAGLPAGDIDMALAGPVFVLTSD